MRKLLLLGVASLAFAFSAAGARANGPNGSPWDLTVWEENHLNASVVPMVEQRAAFTEDRAEAPAPVARHHKKQHQDVQ